MLLSILKKEKPALQKETIKNIPKIKPASIHYTESERKIYEELFGIKSLENREFINIGAGKFSHPYWQNVDYWQSAYEDLMLKKPDINYDLSTLTPLPIENSKINIVYSSHTIEHIQDHMVQYMLEESFRVLRNGGIIRLVCPSAELAWHALKREDMRYFRTFTTPRNTKNGTLVYDQRKYKIQDPNKIGQEFDIYDAFIVQFARQCYRDTEKRKSAKALLASESLENAMYKIASWCDWETHTKSPGDHINWFTEGKLRAMLEKAGFKTILRSGYGQSISPVMRNRAFFDTTRPNFSLYMEAIKEE